MGLKIVWEKPEVADEVKDLMKSGRRRKKPEAPVEWKTKDRFIVGGILLICAFGAAYFWYKGQGQAPDGAWFNRFGTLWDNASLPKVEFKGLDLGGTVVIEK